MSRKFIKKSIASVPLDGGEVEFSSDDFPISFSTEQERSMYSAVSVNRLASQSYELWVDPDGKQEKNKVWETNFYKYANILVCASICKIIWRQR